MSTNLCLQFLPKTIAAAAMYLSVVYLDKAPAQTDERMDKMNSILSISNEDILSITSQIMEIYESDEKFQDMRDKLRAAKKEAGGGGGGGSGSKRPGPPLEAQRPKPVGSSSSSGVAAPPVVSSAGAAAAAPSSSS